MSTQRIQLNPAFLKFIDLHLPQCGGASRVKIHACERLPFQRVWNPSGNYCGLTLWRRIFLRRSNVHDLTNLGFVELLFHEFVHVSQFVRNPWLCPLRYLWLTARRGYLNNPMEVEAREKARTLLEIYWRDELPHQNHVTLLTR